MNFKEFIETKLPVKRSLLASKYPKVRGSNDLVDGRRPTNNVDNMSSIAASLYNYQIMPGIRRVQMSELGNTPYTHSYSVERTNTVKNLAEKIKKSNWISPLIIVINKKGPYVSEGSHRIDALDLLGAKEFPALIVIDTEEIELV